MGTSLQREPREYLGCSLPSAGLTGHSGGSLPVAERSCHPQRGAPRALPALSGVLGFGAPSPASYGSVVLEWGSGTPAPAGLCPDSGHGLLPGLVRGRIQATTEPALAAWLELGFDGSRLRGRAARFPLASWAGAVKERCESSETLRVF